MKPLSDPNFLYSNKKIMIQPIFPCLWYDGKAKEAAEFYCSIFPNSKIHNDTPMVVTFELNGKSFMGLNGGPHFQFNESISFVISCETQEEIDFYWEKLTEQGEETRCGWLKDKFGMSWQVIPSQLGELMSDPKRAPAVMEELMKMKKLDLEKLRNA